MIARHARRSLSAHRLTPRQPLPRHVLLQCSSLSLDRSFVATARPHPRRRRISDASYRRFRERYLATAVGDINPSFDRIPGSPMPSFAPQSFRTHDLKPFDPSMPVVIPEPDPEERHYESKINREGILGDLGDAISVFDACLRVGKLERAMLVLKRLQLHRSLPPEEMIVLHNRYLRASLNQMRSMPDRSQAEKLHKWYELFIRRHAKTAETIACMLKASLLSERGPRLKRLVNRYMAMAPGDAGLRVLSMADILSDQDLAIITSICPTYNFVAELEDDTFVQEHVDDAGELGTAGDEAIQNGWTAPDVLPTPQQGSGLDFLKKGLDFFLGIQDVDVSKLPKADQYEIQMRLERDSVTTAIMKWRHMNENLQKLGINPAIGAGASKSSSLAQHLGIWLVAMEAKIKEEYALINLAETKTQKSEEDLDRCIYGPFLQQSDPARLAAITIISVLNTLSLNGTDSGMPVGSLMTSVGRVAQEDIHAQIKEEEKKARRRRKVEFTGTETQPSPSSNPPIGLSESATDPEASASVKDWSTQLKAKIGGILLKTLIETAKVRVQVENSDSKTGITSQQQPAFSHSHLLRKGKKVGLIFLNSLVAEQMQKEPLGDYLAKHLPMVVEPKPWRRIDDGGFLKCKTTLIRVKPGDVEQRLYTKAAIENGDLKQVFEGLDVLGQTPWRINQNVLQVMLDAWNSGERVANIPELNPNVPTPPEPNADADPLEFRNWRRAIKVIENERSGLHSQRCFMNLQLEIARVFRNQTIYFPHNIDYRGRAYPIPTYLNHMGADHTRSLLMFADGKELGERGLRWLKIQLANVYGLDKSSFDEREAFAMKNIDNIKDSVNNPLNGRRWWLKAEDPWQCLAACFELSAALELPDPTKYISQLPIQQDGTCNGLQHYAALGGDTWGAKQVNLEPGDRPADVYTAVANQVKEGISKDAAAGQLYGKILDGKISRKVVKQTVMTNVYGVTFDGAKKQVCKQIDALYPTLGQESGIPHMLLSSYIAKHIFDALSSMFRGAHDIQYWLGEIGGRVCRALTPAQLQQMADEYAEDNSARQKKGRAQASEQRSGMADLISHFRSTVVWTTPLRLPVVQPYRKNVMREIRTCLQSIVFASSLQTDPVNRRKQLQGFPPNFIHSLDASHMLLSAIQCNKLGIQFAAVHDSFWTHAADVDTMNSVLRESFIQIHEEDVIGRLAAEFKARHRGSLYLAQLHPATAVAKRIRELRKTSKLSPKEELLLEHKRNTLRLSGNPWDLEAANQIVTPAAVYEEMASSAEDLSTKEDVKEIIGLGSFDKNEFAASKEAKSVSGQDELTDDEEGAMSQTANKSADEEESSAAEAPEQLPKTKLPHVPVWLPLTIPDVPKKVRFSSSMSTITTC